MSYTYKLSPKRANVEVKINSVWGTITGNISDQQDLKSELDSIMNSIPDTSNLATKDELDTKANKIDVYTKSEIDSKNYLTSESDPTVPDWAKQPNKPTYTAREVGALPDTTVIPDISPLATKEELTSSLNGKADKTEVYTKSEIDNKGFLTEHQSLDSYALKTEIPDISNLATKDEVAFKIDVYTKTEVDKKIESAGNFDANLYYDKTATDSLLANKADISSLNGKVDKVEGKSLVDDTEIARLATLTNYDDTEVKNQIATKANSADVYTKSESDAKYLTEHQSLENYALKTEIPDITGLATKEELSLKANSSDIPIKTSQLVNDSGYLTEHQSLVDYATKSEIPTLISQLTNDSGYITSIPSEYVTETELSSSLSTKADSANVYTKTEIDNMIGTISSTLDTLNGEVV